MKGEEAEPFPGTGYAVFTCSSNKAQVTAPRSCFSGTLPNLKGKSQDQRKKRLNGMNLLKISDFY